MKMLPDHAQLERLFISGTNIFCFRGTLESELGGDALDATASQPLAGQSKLAITSPAAAASVGA